jgi:hypothetical protein
LPESCGGRHCGLPPSRVDSFAWKSFAGAERSVFWKLRKKWGVFFGRQDAALHGSQDGRRYQCGILNYETGMPKR